MKNKDFIHARLGDEERHMLKELKGVSIETDSALVKRGLKLLYEREVKRGRSFLAAVGGIVGKYRSGKSDLSVHPRHMKGYGR